MDIWAGYYHTYMNILCESVHSISASTIFEWNSWVQTAYFVTYRDCYGSLHMNIINISFHETHNILYYNPCHYDNIKVVIPFLES